MDWRVKLTGGDYKEIELELLQVIGGNAWSIENMEGHEAGDRKVTYIGSRQGGYLDNSRKNGRKIYDYYRDTAGAYWYHDRALLPSGEIVSMEAYLFGREARYMRKKI